MLSVDHVPSDSTGANLLHVSFVWMGAVFACCPHCCCGWRMFFLYPLQEDVLTERTAWRSELVVSSQSTRGRIYSEMGGTTDAAGAPASYLAALVDQ